MIFFFFFYVGEAVIEHTVSINKLHRIINKYMSTMCVCVRDIGLRTAMQFVCYITRLRPAIAFAFRRAQSKFHQADIQYLTH